MSMLPYFDQLRQAALNFQLQAGPRGPMGVPAPPYPMYPGGLDPLLAYRFGPPRFIHEEPKPQHSYIGLIAMAILSNPEQKMVLSDIYQWILDSYPYFRTRGPGWRNSIRHNLSLNDCFIKAGRSANGKGHYWAIHPANVEDFKRGDFRRRRAQRKVRKHMGLSVPDEDEDSDDGPTPSPVAPPALPTLFHPLSETPKLERSPEDLSKSGSQTSPASERSSLSSNNSPNNSLPPKKRNFDMASLLAPDAKKPPTHIHQLLQQTLSPNKIPAFWPFHHFPNPWLQQQQQTPNREQERSPPTAPEEPEDNSPNAAAQWEETFAKIMARSYQGRQAKPQPLSP